MRETIKNLEKILYDSENGKSIFRGEDKFYEDVSSNLYRQYGYLGENPPVLEIEKEMVERARRHLGPNATNIEILTELQHYGASTTLIDFTQNILIALFFACDGNQEHNGRIIQVDTGNIPKISEINYNRAENSIATIAPIGKGPRVIFQSSIFLRSLNGFLDETKYQVIEINSEMKGPILKYLEEKFNICGDTIYDDIQGFIRNQEEYSPTAVKLYLAEKKMRDKGAKNVNS